MLSQPEICEGLWPNWNARTGKRGPDPGYFAKALLTSTAALGISAHLDDNYTVISGEQRDRDDELPRDENTLPTRYQVVFDWIEASASQSAGIQPQSFKFKAYANAVGQAARIVDPVLNEGALTTDGCIFSNIEMFKWLSVTYPSTCLRLGIDGMFIKAWVKQRGKQDDPDKERRIRGNHAPNASARLIEHRGFRRFIRGYQLFALTDIATNLSPAWGLWPAGDSNFEATALRFLLNDLFEKWPECPTTHIVADRAWDNKEAIRDCALRFGIHLIVARDDERTDAE